MTAALTDGPAPAPAGADAGTTTRATVGDREVTLERVSGRKASRALALLRALTRAMPELQSELAAFRRQYELDNVVELDRVQARLRFPGQILVGDDGLPILEGPELPDGSPNPRAGEPTISPSPVDSMSEADWAEAGNVLRLPRSPDTPELALAIFDKALEAAEEHVYRLLALFLMSNEDVTRAWKAGTLSTELDERVDELLDECYGDELLELAVVCAELVDTTFVRKARALGSRLGNLGRLVGLDIPTSPTTTMTDPPAPATSSDGPSSSTPTSSTASPPPTPDGPPTPSSTSPSTSPSSSPPESPATASSPSSSDRPPTPAGAP